MLRSPSLFHHPYRVANPSSAWAMDGVILKGLNDKLYEKRKAAALEVEKCAHRPATGHKRGANELMGRCVTGLYGMR